MKHILFIICSIFLSISVQATCDLSPKFAYSTKGKTLVLKNQSKGDYTSLEWNLGDGTVSKKSDIKHSYDKAGMYTFSLTIYNEEGCSETFEAKVYIFDIQNSPTNPVEENDAVSAQIETDTYTDSDEDANAPESKKLAESIPSVNRSLSSLNNYPNPFVERTKVTFALLEESDVAVNVYDMSGRLVYSALEMAQGIGEQSFMLERGNLKTGAYLLALVAEEETLTRKIVVQ